MTPFTPTNQPTPRPRNAEGFSHERLLQLCYAYRRLRQHATAIQQTLNTHIDEFQHSTRSRDALDRFIERVASVDAGLTRELNADVLAVEIELVRWEMKSSQLRSEAKRQRRRRAERRERGESIPTKTAYLTGASASDVGDVPNYDKTLDEVYATCGSEATETAASPPPGAMPPSSEPVVSPTMAAALRGLKELGPDAPPTTPRFGEAPDTSGYRKSGLV